MYHFKQSNKIATDNYSQKKLQLSVTDEANSGRHRESSQRQRGSHFIPFWFPPSAFLDDSGFTVSEIVKSDHLFFGRGAAGGGDQRDARLMFSNGRSNA